MKKFKAFWYRMAVKLILRENPNLLPDLEREFKRTAKWEPHLRQALSQAIDALTIE